MKLSRIRSNTARESEGMWLTYGIELVELGQPGIDFLIARIGTSGYRDYAEKLARPYRNLIRKQDPKAEEIMRDITLQSVAHCVILDWKNIEDDDGEPIPYSSEAAYEIIKDPAHHDLCDWILGQASDAETFRQEQAEEAAGNSEASSSGTPSTEDTSASSDDGQSEDE